MIIPKVDGLWIEVYVDDEPATEHAFLRKTSGTPHSESSNGIPTKHCYIESKTDSTYYIKYGVSRTFELPENARYLAFGIYIDGRFFTGGYVHRKMLKGENDYIGCISYRTTTASDGRSYSEHLAFQNLSSCLYYAKARL